MTTVDWLILAFVALLAIHGLSVGFLASALSLSGVVAGAYLGSRVASLLLSESAVAPYGPLVTLGGALLFAILGELIARMVGDKIRTRLMDASIGTLDRVGGTVFGAAVGLVFAWVMGVFILQAPLPANLHTAVQHSAVLHSLDERLPSRSLLQAFARFDPLPQLQGPEANVSSPDPALLSDASIEQASQSVVRVTGIACGLGVEGSGWAAAPGLVVTNAHVVAGERYTMVQPEGAGPKLPATPVLIDARNDIAILRVPGLKLPALPLANSEPGEAAAVMGFPENGPFDVQAARIGYTQPVISNDAYGRGPVERTVTSIRGLIRPGNSGGPVVNANGQVIATVFASRVGSESVGYGIPSSIVEELVNQAKQRNMPVNTGECAA